MDEVFKYLRSQGGQGETLSSWEVMFALGLSLMCLTVVCLVYRFTHRTSSYSQSFVQTLVLTGLVTSLIMIVIGSNIARAFSLVGALSIIRFRNAVKETRDVGYIFFAMAIAMACGTRFYMVAILATVAISAVMIVMHLLDFGANPNQPERLLTAQFPPDVDPESTLRDTLKEMFESYSVVSVASVRQGMYTEIVLSVKPRADLPGARVLAAIAKLNNNLKVTYHYGSQSDDA